MSILKDLGRVSAETKGSASGAISKDTGTGAPTPTSYDPVRYCQNGSSCVEIFETNGVTNVQASVYSLFGSGGDACKNQAKDAIVECKF